MAKIYVSYKSTEEPFVRQLMSQLEPEHELLIDYNIPVGADWRSHQLEELRAAEIFVIFVSDGTAGSDFQNAEIGSARLLGFLERTKTGEAKGEPVYGWMLSEKYGREVGRPPRAE